MSISENNKDIKKDAIIIEDYNQNWPLLAKQEIKKISDVISNDNLIDIQHIGSTMVVYVDIFISIE